MPEGAAFWSARSTLLVADLHLGRAESFQSSGVPVPSAVNTRALERLAGAVRRVQAQRVLILGDLLHAPAGLTPSLISTVGEALHALGVTLDVIPGNHDHRLHECAGPWTLNLLPLHHDEGPFRFTHGHLPSPADVPGFVWTGHFHPAATLGSRADALRLPCFVVGETRAVLPAFCRMAAGARLAPQRGDRRFASDGTRVFACPDLPPGRSRGNPTKSARPSAIGM